MKKSMQPYKNHFIDIHLHALDGIELQLDLLCDSY